MPSTARIPPSGSDCLTNHVGIVARFSGCYSRLSPVGFRSNERTPVAWKMTPTSDSDG